MRIQLSRLRIRVVAGGTRYGADLPFDGGLNLIRADNTAGKSTCMASIVWALGLEGMLGPQHAVPLPHAMTSRIEGPDGSEHSVTESHVTLEVRRSDGAHLTIRRQVEGSVNRNLMTAWEGPALSDPDGFLESRDYYVRRSGAAQHERGFHRFFADWCNWELPEVARFDDSTGPLYLEAIAPLWIVEQKRGWAGLQAQTPTHLRIREVKKRALEYTLALDALARRARIQQIERELDIVRQQWLDTVTEFGAEAKQLGGIIRGVSRQPTGDWPPTPEPAVLISRDSQWVPIREMARESAEQIAVFDTLVRSRDAANAEALSELDAAENELDLAMAASAQLRQSIAVDRESAEQAEERLITIRQDKRRHQDLLVLRQLGSDDDSLLHTETCPVCSRTLGDVLLDQVSREHVMGVQETVDYLSTQEDLTKTVLASTEASLDARETQLNALARRSAELRSRVSALQSNLLGDVDMAKIADVLAAQQRLESYERLEEAFSGMLTDLSELSGTFRTMQAELSSLRLNELSESDQRTIDRLRREFLGQLSGYGFRSFNPESMTISTDTYQPAHEGYNPEFESSASDVIRIIWSYLLSLLQVSDELDLNHPGLVIFDEPRQQMAHELSFRELLRRAATGGGQVVFATSESQQNLANMLGDLSSNTINFDGKILKPIGRQDT